jgi:serine-type D-Ala-D-Ala carboxypeptidase (penicillin-binding protein 5/6)
MKTAIRAYIGYPAAVVLIFMFCLFQGQAFASNVDARAAVVLDGQTGRILFAKNPNAKLQPASTTKLVTSMVVLDRMNPDTVVTISREAAMTPSVAPRLRAGDKLTIKDLLSLALIRSVNAAAVALAESVSGSETKFVGLMNEKVHAIGADNTRFINASGLPGDGQHITAFDLALIMKESLRYPLMREIINTRMQQVHTEDGRRLSLRNTNHMLWNDEDVLGGKTGFTRSAGHCLAFAVQKGNTLMVASLLGETNRSKVWDNSATLLALAEDVVSGKSQPEISYTVDAETPFMVAAKRKAYVKRDGRRGGYRHLVSNRVDGKDRGRLTKKDRGKAGSDRGKISRKDRGKVSKDKRLNSVRDRVRGEAAAKKQVKNRARNKNKNKMAGAGGKRSSVRAS